jgi:hypothetical protein
LTLAPLTSLGLFCRIPIYSRRANVVMQSSEARDLGFLAATNSEREHEGILQWFELVASS